MLQRLHPWSLTVNTSVIETNITPIFTRIEFISKLITQHHDKQVILRPVSFALYKATSALSIIV